MLLESRHCILRITNDLAIIYKEQTVFWGLFLKGIVLRSRPLKMQRSHRAAFASAKPQLLPPWSSGPWGHMTSSHQQNLSERKVPSKLKGSQPASPTFSLFPASWLDTEDPVKLLRSKKMCRHTWWKYNWVTVGTVKRTSNKSIVVSHWDGNCLLQQLAFPDRYIPTYPMSTI